MKKASLIAALSLMVMFLTGHYFIYRGVLKSHKKEFKTFIRSNFAKTEQLEINPSQLYTDNIEMKWLDENKEVCLNGVMYDILSIKNAGTKVVLKVVKDADEKELMDRYRDQFNDQYENGKSGKKNNTILKELLSMKYFQRSYWYIHLLISGYNYSVPFLSELSSVYLNVQTPPPLA